LRNSASDSGPAFGVFSSSGKLLAGNKDFKDYSELAKRLDIKRSALYVETGDVTRQRLGDSSGDSSGDRPGDRRRKGEVLLGCSLLAKIKLGREERVVFISKILLEELDREGIWLRKFYRQAKERTEALESIQYDVIGLWKAEDLDSLLSPDFPGFSDFSGFSGPRDSSSPDEFSAGPSSGSPSGPPAEFSARSLARSLAYPAGILLSNQPVSVRVSKIEDGVLLLLGLVSGLKPALHLPFSFALSLYPSGLDLSAGPGEPDPDFFLENGNLRFNPASRGPAASYPAEYYGFLYRAFVRMAERQEYPVYAGSFRETAGNREELFDEVRKGMIEHFGPEISDRFMAKGEIETLFELYRDRPESLKVLADALVARGWAERVFVFRDKDLAAEVIRKLSRADSVSKGLEAFMLELYRGLNSIEEKAEVQGYLLEKGLFYEDFVSELALMLEEGYRKGDPSPSLPSLLMLTANVSFYGNPEGRETFSWGLRKGFDPLSPREAVNFLKHILSTLPSVGEGGKLLLKTLIGLKASFFKTTDKRATDTVDDFVLELSEKQVEKLDSWLGSNYAEARDEKIHTRRKKLMKSVRSVILILLALAVLGAIALAFLNYGPPIPGIGNTSHEDENASGSENKSILQVGNSSESAGDTEPADSANSTDDSDSESVE